ncbi:CPCC family cysteine-rich protein [Alienimonas sp. DA493]|uniref:CPCC family cysteine-rich protein n=1 Tax=Alienimonas sp. DA493 TaxID=3373605 RepID=UPI003753F376
MPFRCPVCDCRTLSARCDWEICPVCFWEDDVREDGRDPNAVTSGANGGLTLARARENYAACGACDPAMVPHVRPPRPEERADRGR